MAFDFDNDRVIPMFASSPSPANPTQGGGVDNEPPDAAEDDPPVAPGPGN